MVQDYTVVRSNIDGISGPVNAKRSLEELRALAANGWFVKIFRDKTVHVSIGHGTEGMLVFHEE